MAASSMMNSKNWNMLVGVLSLLVGFWLVLYVVPDFFRMIFHTILGNLILLGLVVLVGMRNLPMALVLAAIFIVMYRSIKL